MQKSMIPATLVLLCSLFITGCIPGPYKIDIEQGNVITSEMVDQLRVGMTRNQVEYIMGTSLLDDTFDRNRWDYVYSYQKGGKKPIRKQVTVFFTDDVVSKIDDQRDDKDEKATE